jgi:hypothetical protein|tara:strand:- start:31 stop:507 length:477 start_codon:yes stop_codon:yes gene_type:complete
MRHLLTLCLLTSIVIGQQILRVVPDGTKLANGLVAPIHLVEYTAPQIEDPGNPRDAGKGQAHLRLKDANGTSLSLYVKRDPDTDLDGTKTPMIQLFLSRPGGATGASEVEEKSKAERTYLLTLRSADENYAPGWTQNWSIQNHKALKQIIADLYARNP